MQAQLWVYNFSGLVRYKDTDVLGSFPVSGSYNLSASSSWMTPEPWGKTQYSNAGTWTYGLLLSCTFRQNYIFNINLRSWSFSTKWFLLLWFLFFCSRISRSYNLFEGYFSIDDTSQLWPCLNWINVFLYTFSKPICKNEDGK